MYLISELAKKVELSRTALLYYEKIELIKGVKAPNGYRYFSDLDVQTILLIKQLHAGGLKLKECKACLLGKIEPNLLSARLTELEQEIKQKLLAKELLQALLGRHSQREIHENLQQIAPKAHLDWLTKQGFSEVEASKLQWISKDMSEHDEYMTDFMQVFESLECWGPGSNIDREKALKLLPFKPKQIVEFGCGQGMASFYLSQNTAAKILATDIEEQALVRLKDKAEELNLHNLKTAKEDMNNLSFAKNSLEVIWAETCAYIIGVETALNQWHKLLMDNGILVISDLVWSIKNPSKDAKNFWQKEYPDIKFVNTRLTQAKKAGFNIIDHFPISKQAWDNYYLPLNERVKTLKKQKPNSRALNELQKEIDIYFNHHNEIDYQMFILQKTSNR